MLKALIFDLDQTLVDRSATFKLFLTKQHARFSNELSSLSAKQFVEIALRFDNNGYAPKNEMYAQTCSEIGISSGEALFNDFLQNYGEEPILFKDTMAVLETLSKNYPLGLISNGRTKGQNLKIDKAGIRHFFKVIKISETENIKKPNPLIFERCLSDLGVKSEHAAYIGDHPEKDVIASQSIGMKGIWLRNSHYSAPENADGIIHNLSDLIDLLPILSLN